MINVRYSNEPSEDVDIAMNALRKAVSQELDRKRKLGHYAVFWKDGQVVYEGDDAPVKSPSTPPKTT
jgi:hypothetical protein